MEIKIEEALVRIGELEEKMEWAAAAIGYLQKWRDKMEGVYPIHEVKESVQQNTYDKLTSFASKNRVSVNKALITLIEKADEEKENKK